MNTRTISTIAILLVVAVVAQAVAAFGLSTVFIHGSQHDTSGTVVEVLVSISPNKGENCGSVFGATGAILRIDDGHGLQDVSCSARFVCDCLTISESQQITVFGPLVGSDRFFAGIR